MRRSVRESRSNLDTSSVRRANGNSCDIQETRRRYASFICLTRISHSSRRFAIHDSVLLPRSAINRNGALPRKRYGHRARLWKLQATVPLDKSFGGVAVGTRLYNVANRLEIGGIQDRTRHCNCDAISSIARPRANSPSASLFFVNAVCFMGHLWTVLFSLCMRKINWGKNFFFIIFQGRYSITVVFLYRQLSVRYGNDVYIHQ